MACSRLQFFLTSFVLCLAFVASTEARRSRRTIPSSPESGGYNKVLSEYTPPLSNGSSSLPSPTSGTRLKAIALGRGTQNYSCNAGSEAAPVAIGAVAVLFDATPLISMLPESEGMLVLDLLPDYLIDFNFGALENSTLDVIGHHYFNSLGQPTFNLGTLGLLVGKKVGDIAAPPNSCKGPLNQGDGAVDWLNLASTNGSWGVCEAYRVETAGGKAPATCAGISGLFEVQYAAQYWFLE